MIIYILAAQQDRHATGRLTGVIEAARHTLPLDTHNENRTRTKNNDNRMTTATRMMRTRRCTKNNNNNNSSNKDEKKKQQLQTHRCLCVYAEERRVARQVQRVGHVARPDHLEAFRYKDI
jgi:hypothetical protein